MGTKGVSFGVLHKYHYIQTCEGCLVQNELVKRRLRIQVTLFFFLLAFIVIVAVVLKPIRDLPVVKAEEVILEFCFSFQTLIQLLGDIKVSFIITVIIVPLTDFLVNFVDLLALLSAGLLVLNALHAVKVWLLRFDPGAFVCNYVFMVQFRNGFDLLHYWVRLECQYSIFLRITVPELHVDFDLL